jgi:hypothetical protein
MRVGSQPAAVQTGLLVPPSSYVTPFQQSGSVTSGETSSWSIGSQRQRRRDRYGGMGSTQSSLAHG